MDLGRVELVSVEIHRCDIAEVQCLSCGTAFQIHIEKVYSSHYTPANDAMEGDQQVRLLPESTRERLHKAIVRKCKPRPGR
jgi:hypothetical protein